MLISGVSFNILIREDMYGQLRIMKDSPKLNVDSVSDLSK